MANSISGPADPAGSILQSFWHALGADDRERPLPAVELAGEPGGLPSVYAVEAFATATVAVATAAVAELVAARAGEPVRAARLDRAHVAAAFRSERYLEPIGWMLPPIWDPIAGDYRTADGWIRIHTNYASHRAAALRALAVTMVAPTREAVAAAVATRPGEDVEAAVVGEGGAAAVMRTAAAWAAHPQGRAVAAESLIAVTRRPVAAGAPRRATGPGLRGLRVLDLTRVIAGPVCTRVLAAYGAEVLRIDPPGFDEVGALIGDTTAGKRRAALDLRTEDGRARAAELLATADLLVCGYRASALARLGFDEDRLAAIAPALVVVQLDAYGFTGPWRDRRGFDSLVQMSTGIAARASTGDAGAPGVLPAQALDHGTGYLLAAAACRALTRRLEDGVATRARLSLARVARELMDLGDHGDPRAPARASGDPFRERADSALGPLLRVRCPGELAGLAPRWTIPPGPLGVDAPAWP